MATLTIERINAIAELNRANIAWESSGEDEVKLLCPFHNDNSPSFSLNTAKNLGLCHVCETKTDIIGVFAQVLRIERQLVILDFGTRYDLEDVKSINPERVEEMHVAFWEKAGPLKKELYDRGVTDSDIRKYRLGFTEGRISIPVYDEAGRVRNIRKYSPGAPGPEKMRNTPGYGEMRLFMPDQLKYEILWLVGGELKAVVAARLLNPADIGVFAVTAGEGAWDNRWSKQLKNKTLYICMDVDQKGTSAAKKLAQVLKKYVTSVAIINLPLDLDKHPKGDINDYVGTEGATGENLVKLMDSATLLKEDEGLESAEIPIEVNLSEVQEHVGKKMTFKGTPIAADTQPYLLPRCINISCTQDQKCCTDCSIPSHVDAAGISEVDITLNRDNPGQLLYVDSNQDREELITRKVVGIPRICKAVNIRITDRRPVYDIRITDNVDNTVGHIAAFVTGDKLELNVPHLFHAQSTPSPKDNKLVLLAEDAHPTQDGLDQFELTTEDKANLQIFQPAQWSVEGITNKLDEVYEDFEANITHIYYRKPLHIVMDLVFHSPLYMNFGSREISGWLDVLVIGDSAQGKSETAQRLCEFYGLGARADCKNATRAGLVGSVKMMGKRWFISWGLIPANDRRLVVLEEAKGLDKKEIAQMTDMRSRGIAELTKVETSQANARTRLLWLSNPRKGEMSTFNYGIESMLDVIGAPEDVRRFDLALVVHKDEVNADEIASFIKHGKEVEHRFTADLCRRLVLFAWTRKADQIYFSPAVTTECINASVRLSNMFDHAIPLIDPGTVRFKLARIAAAVAARTFSIEGENIVVLTCHIQWAEEFLVEIYSNPYHGYLEWSKVKKDAIRIKDSQAVVKWIRTLQYPAAFVEGCLAQDEITRDDLEDLCEMDREQARMAVSFLVRYRCLQREYRVYVKNPEFITLLKGMEDVPEKNDIKSLYEEEM